MGYLFVILASILFGSYPSIQEHVMTTGATPLGMVIVCNSVAGLSSLIIGLIRRESFKLDKKMFGSLALTGILGLFLTDYLLNTSYTMIPVGFTTMIHFLYPSLVCMTMVFVYKEKLTKGKVGAIVLSIVGLILLSGGDFSGDKRGVFVAIATAFAYGFYMISNDKSSVAKVPLMARSFYLNLFVAIAALITNIFTKSAVLPSGAENIEPKCFGWYNALHSTYLDECRNRNFGSREVIIYKYARTDYKLRCQYDCFSLFNNCYSNSWIRAYFRVPHSSDLGRREKADC